MSQSTPNLSPPPTQPHPAYRPPGPADPAKPMAFSKSTMFTKISDMHRGMVDKAIIDRDPPTYKEIYETFALPDHGVSFSAFYFYARRIRMLQSLDAGRHADLPRPEDLDAGIRDAITQRLYETLNNPDEPAPLDLQRLVSTWRHAIQTCRSLQESRDASSKK